MDVHPDEESHEAETEQQLPKVHGRVEEHVEVASFQHMLMNDIIVLHANVVKHQSVINLHS